MKENAYYNIIVNVTFVLFLLTMAILLVSENNPRGRRLTWEYDSPVDLKNIDFDKVPAKGATSKRAAKKRFAQIARKYDPLIIKIAKAHGAEPRLIRAIVMTESGYQPHARSKCGALGLMQLMPETARSMGVRNAFNPKENITGGVKYFQYLLKAFKHDRVLALAAYNAGIGMVRKYNNKVPPFPETRNFIRRVYHYYAIL